MQTDFKQKAILGLTSFVLLHSQAVLAADEKALAQAKNCLACHAIDHKVVGPSYKDVAAKYAGQTDASSRLANKVISGGGGVWGPVPMPANPQVSPAEAKRLVDWILWLKSTP
jgi:cytochrome c